MAPKSPVSSRRTAAAVAKKSPARTQAATKAVAKKAPAKKTVAAKTVAKKVIAKKTPAQKAVSKKTQGAKAIVKKAPAKKAPAKKVVTKKAVAKKVAPEKVAPEKIVAKKAPAKKAAPATAAARRASVAPVAPVKAVPKRPAKPAYDAAFIERQTKALLEERATYVEQASSLRAEAQSLVEEMEPGDIQFDDESGEGGTITVDRERDLALSAQALVAVEEIDAALAKIKAGRYGICENCGEVIPKARLEALPYPRLCISCKNGGLSRR